ncbi:MAG: hypothetical protein LBS36_00765 [Oscillospiraceae bacterium]|nr:hypothetical protein [Oscillospiraceae bacterium]
MRLNVQCRLSQGDSFFLRVNGQEQEVDFDHFECSFEINAPEDYTLEIFQIPTKKKNMARSLLLLACTCVLRGIFSTIFMDTDSGWHKNIRPYTISAKHPLHIEDDTAVFVSYKKAVISPETKKCVPPALSVDEIPAADFQAEPNPNDFFTRYWSYLQKVLSIYSVCLLVLGIVLYGGIKSGNMAAILLCGAVLLALGLLVAWLARKEYKRMQALLTLFRSQHTLS